MDLVGLRLKTELSRFRDLDLKLRMSTEIFGRCTIGEATKYAAKTRENIISLDWNWERNLAYSSLKLSKLLLQLNRPNV